MTAELKQALADAELAHIAADEAYRAAAEAHALANVALSNAAGAVELARRNLLDAVLAETLA